VTLLNILLVELCSFGAQFDELENVYKIIQEILV